MCLTFYRGQYKVSADALCAGLEKPPHEQKCNLKPCQPEWFTSDWSRVGSSFLFHQVIDFVDEFVFQSCGVFSPKVTRV